MVTLWGNYEGISQHSAGIRSNGIEKVLAGETSLDEVLRVTMEA
ncbi:hypothetical protein [Escherichia coli]|nr:hypothetical protein [Escherichia coli]